VGTRSSTWPSIVSSVGATTTARLVRGRQGDAWERRPLFHPARVADCATLGKKNATSSRRPVVRTFLRFCDCVVSALKALARVLGRESTTLCVFLSFCTPLGCWEPCAYRNGPRGSVRCAACGGRGGDRRCVAGAGGCCGCVRGTGSLSPAHSTDGSRIHCMQTLGVPATVPLVPLAINARAPVSVRRR
jgi:hypothetical protein